MCKCMWLVSFLCVEIRCKKNKCKVREEDEDNKAEEMTHNAATRSRDASKCEEMCLIT